MIFEDPLVSILEYGERRDIDVGYRGIALELQNVPMEFGAKVGIETCIRG